MICHDNVQRVIWISIRTWDLLALTDIAAPHSPSGVSHLIFTFWITILMGVLCGFMPCCSSALVRPLGHLNGLLPGHCGHSSKLQISAEHSCHMTGSAKCLFFYSLYLNETRL